MLPRSLALLLHHRCPAGFKSGLCCMTSSYQHSLQFLPRSVNTHSPHTWMRALGTWSVMDWPVQDARCMSGKLHAGCLHVTLRTSKYRKCRNQWRIKIKAQCFLLSGQTATPGANAQWSIHLKHTSPGVNNMSPGRAESLPWQLEDKNYAPPQRNPRREVLSLTLPASCWRAPEAETTVPSYIHFNNRVEMGTLFKKKCCSHPSGLFTWHIRIPFKNRSTDAGGRATSISPPLAPSSDQNVYLTSTQGRLFTGLWGA